MKKQKNNCQSEVEQLLLSKSNMSEIEIEVLKKKLVRLENRCKKLKQQNGIYLAAANRNFEQKEILAKENTILKNQVAEQRLTITMLSHCLYFSSDKDTIGQNNPSCEQSRDTELKKAMKILIPLAHSAKNDLLKKCNLKEYLGNQN